MSGFHPHSPSHLWACFIQSTRRCEAIRDATGYGAPLASYLRADRLARPPMKMKFEAVPAQDSLADPDMLYDSKSSLKDAFGALYRVCSSGSDNTCGQFARESAGEPIYQLLDVRDVYCGPCASPRAKPHPSRHPEPRRFRRAARRLRRPRRRAPARAQGPAVRGVREQTEGREGRTQSPHQQRAQPGPQPAQSMLARLRATGAGSAPKLVASYDARRAARAVEQSDAWRMGTQAGCDL